MSEIEFQKPCGVLRGVSLATANTDYSIVVANGSYRYILRRLVITNPTATLALSTATYGLFSAASGGGTAFLPTAANGIAGPVVATDFAGTVLIGTKTATGPIVYFRVGNAHSAAVTVDVYLYGDIVP